jgi:hypothetical protein
MREMASGIATELSGEMPVPWPGPPGRRGFRASARIRLRRLRSTPGRVRLMAASAIAVSVCLGALVAALSGGIAGGVQVIGHQSDPEVLAATDLYFRLNDMDAQVANVLLVGRQHGLGISRAQAQAIYEQDRIQAGQDLQRAAEIAGSLPSAQRPLRSVLDGLGSYEALAAEAMYLDGQDTSPPGRPPGAALVLYRQATDLLQGRILPAALSLTSANAAALDSTYQADRSAAVQGEGWTVLLGVALLAVLLGLQVYLAIRFRRLINPALAVASLIAVALMTVSGTALHAQAGHLHVAKADAFDSIIALSQARAISDDGNADESRYLVDPARAGQYQQAFEARSQQLARLPGVGIFQYDAALARAIAAYQARNSDVRFGGYLGAEFRNITFPGERAAAQRALAAYQIYERDDRHIRALNDSGDLSGAIAFDTSYARGNSNWAFTRYETALSDVIAINQRAFNQAISQSHGESNGLTSLIPGLAVILITGLVLAGVRPRLAEYR